MKKFIKPLPAKKSVLDLWRKRKTKGHKTKFFPTYKILKLKKKTSEERILRRIMTSTYLETDTRHQGIIANFPNFFSD